MHRYTTSHVAMHASISVKKMCTYNTAHCRLHASTNPQNPTVNTSNLFLFLSLSLSLSLSNSQNILFYKYLPLPWTHRYYVTK